MRRARLTIAIVAVITPAPQALTAPCVDGFSFAHVRAPLSIHRALLRQGYERSATFRQLIVDIEASQWVVFVQTGRCPDQANIACLLHFVGTFEGRSYVRVIVRHEQRHPDNVIASLAHELQHAREVVQAAGVYDAGDLRDLFKRIGRVSVKRDGVETYETAQALDIGETVWRELMGKRDRWANVKQTCGPSLGIVFVK